MIVSDHRIPLTSKESEALLWGLAQIGDHVQRTPVGSDDPLFILLEDGWPRRAIARACEELSPVAVGNWLAGGWSELEQTILRLCVENTTWITIYRTHDITAGDSVMIEEALATLRSLAAKLDSFGIEVNYIPHA